MSTADEQEQTTEQATEQATGEIRIPCLVYSRIVGYLTPIQSWNKGKRQEWDERRAYHVPASNDGEQVPVVREASQE
jgi:ribonucleoside-triphosphate reductase